MGKRNYLWITVFAFYSLMTGATEMDADKLQWHFIKNFVQYTKWPSTSLSDNFSFCVIGRSALARLAVKGTVKKTLPLVIHAFEDRLPRRKELLACHAVYFSKNLNYGELKFLLSQLDKSPVLSISEQTNFILQGGLVQFIREGNKLRFMINGQASRAQGLTISPALLRLSHNQVTP